MEFWPCRLAIFLTIIVATIVDRKADARKAVKNDTAYRDNSCTTSDRFVKILDLREGNEESSEETTGCKASVYAEFDDCPRVGKFVKLFDFWYFESFFRFDQSDRKTYKKAISDGVNVSVVLDCGFGNTSKEK